MIIAATGDIHSPLNYELFVKSINNLQANPDLFLITGDVIDRKSTGETDIIKEFQKVSNALFGVVSCPIFACFGNNEFESEWDEIRLSFPDIKFLQDESAEIEVKGKKVGIVGSKGSLDRPTWWQKNNIPNISEIYKKRVEKIEGLLDKLKVDYKILLIHYPPTYKILAGENPRAFPELACQALERVVIEKKIDLVLTGHAHKGKKEAWLDGIPVINAGLTLNNGLVIIDTEKLKPGLGRFFS